ncbi:Prolipoprotein diacylglyceryl transferase [bacterium HR17]|uniref:Phosphatidylglycerol--prolipoprotein diacylglyceryl transferase n=1 Tax=Candidatus Fervidibacter japonicus TaxID=2035412 RepID=A0A2H5XDU9_9BACT|nr:Prolipoprotein diacylglyceryl transferase [bacterium HR17]
MPLHPVLLKCGPFTLRSYGVMVAVGVLIGFWWTRREFRRRQLPLDALYDATIAAMALGVIGARLLYVALHWSIYRTHLPAIAMIWADGGLSFHGAVLGGVLGVWWVTRRYRLPFGQVADAAAPGTALGHAFGRIGCFLNGCCYGAPTTLPLGVRFHNPALGVDTLPSHPAQLYEAAGLAVLFLWLVRYRRFAPYTGAVFVMWVMGYAVLRFFVEFARAGATATVVNGLTQAQWVSIVLFCGALAYHRWRYRSA